MAKNNPIRFSTKYQDDESDLLFYGYRYYKASTGTWLSRDPIGEIGHQELFREWLRSIRIYLGRWHLPEDKNLYNFVFNDTPNDFDVLGHCSEGTCGDDATSYALGILKNVVATFTSARFFKQCAACDAMYDPIYAGFDWDIHAFANDYPYTGDFNCKNNTFTFKHNCYWGGSLDYLLWGEMNNLCGYPLTLAQMTVWAWKHNPFYLPNPIAVRQALGMTQIGYNDGVGGTFGGFGCLPNLKYKVPRQDSDWKWWPIKGNL